MKVMVGKGFIEALIEALKLTAIELMQLVPKILASIVILALFIVVARLLSSLAKKIVELFKLEDLLKPLMDRYQVPISITSIILALLNIGIALLAFYSIVMLLFPEHLELASASINMVSRLLSVISLMLFAFIAVAVVTERVKAERGLRGFMVLLITLISMVLVVDIAALSEEVKSSLTWGLSLGIGLSIGVFTAWFFFAEKVAKPS
ncbi:MAG: hypothetical protein DRO09_00610 [Thermoprotei archaeon]|nr:MAG: hypothetical protein DRO09_00610 [Thermoprotei archaeon]